MILSRRPLFVGVGLLGLASSTLAFGWWQVDGPGADNGAEASNPLLPLPLDQMAFTLTSHSGEIVSPADWIGRPTMVFFGFTFCPDVCPTTLSDISDWLTDIGAEADRLNVALISVDPERDTAETLADYLSNFDPRIVGHTGTLDQIADAASGFRASYEKVYTDEGDYAMNHTAGVFLFHADGSFASVIDFHEDRRFAVPKIRRILT